MPEWDEEVEGVQGWRKAEPLRVGAGDPERDQDRAGCVGVEVAAPGHQAEEQRGRVVGRLQVLGRGMGRGGDAGVEGAVGAAGARMPLVRGEEGVGAQSVGLENLWGSQEESAGLGVL